MQTDALTATFAALADATRRDLVARLARGDATVTELAAPYDMSLAAVSKHLQVLERAGLVSRRREAQSRPCHLEAAPLGALAAWVEEYRRFWDRSLDSLASYLDTLQRGDAPAGASPRRRRGEKKGRPRP